MPGRLGMDGHEAVTEHLFSDSANTINESLLRMANAGGISWPFAPVRVSAAPKKVSFLVHRCRLDSRKGGNVWCGALYML
jgi:hypothetical protein